MTSLLCKPCARILKGINPVDKPTALMIASMSGHVSPCMTNALSSSGSASTINTSNSKGATALWLAASAGQTAAVQLLLDHGADVSKGMLAANGGSTPLYCAAAGGHVDTVKILLQAIQAKQQHHLIDTGNAHHATPLFIAAQHNHVAVMQLLLGAGASVECKSDTGATPLFVAAQNGNVAGVRLLLDKGADIDAAEQVGATPLYATAQGGHHECMLLLLNHLQDKHGNATKDMLSIRRTDTGATAMYTACEGGHVACVLELLARGADASLGLKDTNYTPLMAAVQFGRANVVEALMTHGRVDVNVASVPAGITALYTAAVFGQLECARLLIVQGGADVNATTSDGFNPLLAALVRKQAVIAEFLIACGATSDSSFMGTRGNTIISTWVNGGRRSKRL